MHFGFALDLSDIDLLNIELLDQWYTHLDLLDTDMASKHFVCFQDVLKTSARHVFKTSLRHVFKTSWRRLQRNNFSSSKTFSRRLARCLQDVFKTSSRRLGRRKNVTLKTYWRRFQDMSWRRLEDQQMFAGVTCNLPVQLQFIWVNFFQVKCGIWLCFSTVFVK